MWYSSAIIVMEKSDKFMEAGNMVYPYATLSDTTEVVHSEMGYYKEFVENNAHLIMEFANASNMV